MRISVDLALCESNGICIGMAPDVFGFGIDDKASILVEDIPESRRREMSEVVGSCPRAALTLEDNTFTAETGPRQIRARS